ncbi:MAG TPA: hypothetical protein ENJ97_05565 [Planctomycetes bacterium]|nr:hypothetical protein [Planctomycetota bacterium]
MITIHLHQEEAQILKGYVRQELDELHSEIVHTDDWEFRNYLKEVRSILARIHENLERVLGKDQDSPGAGLAREAEEA